MRKKLFEIASFALGMFQTNCYVIWPADASSPDAKKAIIIDPGQWPEQMLAFMTEKGLTADRVVLTHAHADHIMGLHEVRALWPDVPILIHPNETKFLTDPVLNLSAMGGEPFIAPTHTGTICEPGRLEFAGHAFEIFDTPGHSPGSISLWLREQKIVIAGDALFRGSVGRVDFPGGSMERLSKSIREKIYTLPDDTIVFPGHGPETTVGYEKRNNPYVRA